MSALASRPASDVLELDTDVLVIGGGPAAVWAALTARAEGARVTARRQGLLRLERRRRCRHCRALVGRPG